MRRRMTDLFDDLPVEQLNKMDNQTQLPSKCLKKPKRVFNMKWVAAIIIVIGVAFGGTAVLASPKLFESKHKITICVDPELQFDVESAVFVWEKLYGARTAVVEVLPSDAALAEAKIAKIRTQMMAGEGPDIFIMNCPNSFYVEKDARLFDNPEQAMRTDVFLPLDEYMAQAEYMNPSNWNQTILDAGKTDEGQMVLPMTYEYLTLVAPTEILGEADNLPETMDEFLQWDNETVKEYVSSRSSLMMLYSLGNLCDYDENTVLYTEETILERMRQIEQYTENVDLKLNEGLFNFGVTETGLFQTFFGAEPMAYVPYTNENGGINAIITAYAAINANTKKPDKAFEFLDIMFSDYLLSGSGFPVEGYDVTIAAGSHWIDGISIYNEDKICRLIQVTDEENAMIREATDRIDQVRFGSSMDRDFMDIYDRMTFHRGNPLTDDELRTLISDMLDRWKLQLAE